jgi:hypothetical protein
MLGRIENREFPGNSTSDKTRIAVLAPCRGWKVQQSGMKEQIFEKDDQIPIKVLMLE